MKHILQSLVLFTACISFAQSNGKLISKTLVSDLSDSPFYSKLIKESDSNIVWKDEYKYIDSIDIFKISYFSDSLKVNGYVVKPKQTGKYPCVIYNRGGSGKYGTLTDVHAAVFLGELAKEGFVVIASQYRGNGGSEGLEEFGGEDVNDVIVLPEVLNEIKDADTTNIGMLGWSRGGMMTYLALTRTNKIKAAIVGGAVSNLLNLTKDRPEMESEVISKLIPNYELNKASELNKRSAVKWAYKFNKDVPILILHGGSDKRVNPEQSLSMALELQKHHIPYRLIIYENGDHSIKNVKKEVNEEIIGWFNRFLRKKNDAIRNTIKQENKK